MPTETNVKPGWIVLVPKGIAVTFSEDGERPTHRMPRPHVAVVDHVSRDAEEPQWLAYEVGGNYRYVLADTVTVLQADDHRVHVGPRRIRGGHPVRGMGNLYYTSGRCACGAEFSKRATAREVREHWRYHVLRMAETYMEANDMGRAPGLPR